MVRLFRHRQTKEAATDKPNLLLPRHISTLHLVARYTAPLRLILMTFDLAALPSRAVRKRYADQ
jgi:hypothetical protein